MIGVVLAAGNGTRIAGYHHCASKVLITIEGKTLIESNMARIAPYVDSFIVVVGRAADAIISTLGHVFRGKPIHFVNQPVRDGPLGALKCALGDLDDEDIILVLGDEFLVGDRIRSCLEIFNRRYPASLLGVIPDSNEEDIAQTYSVEYNGDREVTRITEKPSEFPNRVRGTGYYFISAKVLRMADDVQPRLNGQYELADLFNHAIDCGEKIITRKVAEKAYNVNTVEILRELTG